MLKNKGTSHIADDKLDIGLVTAMKDAQAEETAGMTEIEIEKVNARRMLRVAGWSTVFCAFLSPNKN